MVSLLLVMIYAALMAVVSAAVDADVAKDNNFDFLVFAQIWDVANISAAYLLTFVEEDSFIWL